MNSLNDDKDKNTMIDSWMNRKKICVLGAGRKPLTQFNRDSFPGLENVDQYEAVNVDIRDYPTTDVIQDLSVKHWGIESNSFDIVIAEHVAEHLQDRLTFISECLRITKPNGLLIIEVPNYSHLLAHSNLEHYTTWSRVVFDESYLSSGWVKEKVVYRATFLWKSWYIKREFLGRQLDRFTGLISGLRFYLRVK